MQSVLVSSLALIANGRYYDDRRAIAEFHKNHYGGSLLGLGGAVSCSNAGDLARNFVVSVDNDAPTQGQNVTTTFDFDLEAPITGGTAYYSATLNGLGPFTSTAALCDETAKTNDPCPLAVGHHHQVSVAANTVTGKVVTTITWEDESGAQILCAQITIKSS